MNTKHRIVSVLLILTMVVALCAVAVTPASAASVTQPTVTLSNPVTLTAAPIMTVTFYNTTALAIGDVITLGLPGVWAAAGNPTAANYTINGVASGAAATKTEGATDTIIFTCPAAITAGSKVTLVIAAAAALPNPVAGTYTATIVTTTDTTATTSVPFVVLPATSIVDMSTYSGPVGTPVSVAATATPAGTFANTAYMSASFDGAALAIVPTTAQTGATGILAAGAFSFSVPAAAAGVHTVGISDGVNTYYQTFTVTPKVSFTPAAGALGSLATVTGSGFTANRSVDISGGATGTATTDATGSFTATCGISGAAAVKATDGANLVATSATNVALTAGITLTPSSGLGGTTVTVTTVGFNASVAAGAIASTTFYMPAPNNVTASMTPAAAATATSATGATAFTFTVPTTATSGAKTVTVIDAAGTAASATFTVDSKVISVTPATGVVGTSVTVTGTGFPAYTYVYLAHSTTAAGYDKAVQADGDGKISGVMAIPTSATTAGTTYINAYDTATQTNLLTRAAFVIQSSTLAISPARGPVGTEVTVTLTAGTRSSARSILYTNPDTAVQSIVGTLITDGAGNGTATITIPFSQAGNGTITVDTAAAKTFVVTAGTVAVDVSQGLASVAGKYTKVWAFDSATQEWTLYDTAEGATNTLSSMSRGQGYWIQATEAATLLYGGNSYALAVGWNLIGWLG